jgi:hypothetical protein
MAFEIDTVATAIAGLTIAGVYGGGSKNVVIKDLTGVPEAVDARQCPVLYPEPVGMVQNILVNYDSFGPGTSAKITVTYDLTYTLAFAKIGQERGLFTIEQEFIKTVKAILTAFITNDSLNGAVEIHPSEVSNFGPIADPSGATYHGCQFKLSVLEFVN